MPNRRHVVRGLLIILLIAVVLLAGCQVIPAAPATPAGSGPGPLVSQSDNDSTEPEETHTPVTAQDGLIRLSTGELDDGAARFYVYEGQNKAIRFFVLKSSDGVVRAALDACDVCYWAGLGYRQEGDAVICNNCGNRFPSTSISEVQGGCNPVPLEREAQGDTLVIQVSDLEAGGRYF